MEIDEKQIKKIINELFSKYKKTYIYENEYTEFLKEKGYNVQQARKIIFEAFRIGLIDIGVDIVEEGKGLICIWRPEDVDE